MPPGVVAGHWTAGALVIPAVTIAISAACVALVVAWRTRQDPLVDWIGKYQQFWRGRLRRLENLLKDLDS